MFALHNSLQGGNTIPKWDPRARLGVNLGPSPFHARNVYLVLNVTSGLVSPQYHVSFDDFFETVRQSCDTNVEPMWKSLAGLLNGQGVETGLKPREGNGNRPATSSTGHAYKLLKTPQVSPNIETRFEEDDSPFLEPSDVFDITASLEGQADGKNDTDPVNVQENKRRQTRTRHPQVLHDDDRPTQDASFGTSSKGRQRKMSSRMQDSVAQGHLRNFNQEMSANVEIDPVLLANDYDA